MLVDITHWLPNIGAMTKHVPRLVGLLSFAISLCLLSRPTQAETATDTRVAARTVSQESSIPSRVREALARNAADIDPISLVWTQQKSAKMPLPALLSRIQCKYEYGFLEPVNNVFMWQGQKGYSFSTSKCILAGGGAEPVSVSEAYEKKMELAYSSSERSFDGEYYYSASYVGSEYRENTPNSPVLGVLTLEQRRSDDEPRDFVQKYLTKIGYKFPNSGSELGRTGESYVLYLADRGRVIECGADNGPAGGSVFVVKIEANYVWDWHPEIKRVFVFHLSPKHNYAVKEYSVQSLDGKLAYHFRSGGFFQVKEKSVFLPRTTIGDYYTYATVADTVSPTPLFTETSRLQDVSTETITAKTFDLRNKFTHPGTCIADNTLRDDGEQVLYQIPANPADLDRAIEAALSDSDFVPTPVPPLSAWVRFVIVAVGLGLLMSAVYRIVLRNRRGT